MAAMITVHGRQAIIEDGVWRGDELLCRLAEYWDTGPEWHEYVRDPDLSSAHRVVRELGGEVTNLSPPIKLEPGWRY